MNPQLDSLSTKEVRLVLIVILVVVVVECLSVESDTSVGRD